MLDPVSPRNLESGPSGLTPGLPGLILPHSNCPGGKIVVKENSADQRPHCVKQFLWVIQKIRIKILFEGFTTWACLVYFRKKKFIHVISEKRYIIKSLKLRKALVGSSIQMKLKIRGFTFSAYSFDPKSGFTLPFN